MTTPMIGFRRLPRSYRATIDLQANLGSIEIDVWRIGRPANWGAELWRWTVYDGRVYTASGESDSLDNACKAAVAAAEL